MTVNRRRFLASTAAASAAAAVFPTSALGAEYEEIQARGQSIRIGSGETWENKLIDFGDRNNITITAKDSNWTIRNIGFKGTIPYNETIFGVCDSGDGTSVMENIYFGEATGEQPASERSICIWVDPDHSGHLDVRNVNFNVPGNNGIYGSAPGYNGDGGTIHIDNCYGNDNHHTSFRISDNGSKITNSVSYKSGTRAANRGAWVWEGNYSGGATIEDSHFITNGTGGGVVTHDNPDLNMNNVATDDGSGTTGNPEHFVPEGCPETAQEAVGGDSGGDSPDDSPNNDDGSGDDTPDEEPERDQKDGYERVTVPAGYTHNIALEEGETYENVLIDISADQAEFSITTQGNNCTIRNVGIRGEWDATTFETPIDIWTEDADGEVLIENLYFADGAMAATNSNGPSGVYVPQDHAGMVTIRNLHAGGLPAGAVYASAPGGDEGAGGDVIIEDSYAANTDPFGYLVGTDGSRVENCVAVKTPRGGIGGLNNPTFVDCDFAETSEAAVSGGRGDYDGIATIENVRGEQLGDGVEGELVGPAQRDAPEDVAGVPLSAEQAASGGGANGDDGEDDSSDSPDETPDESPDDEPDNSPDDTPDDSPGDEPDETPDESPNESPDGGSPFGGDDSPLDGIFGDGGMLDNLFGDGGLLDSLFDGLFGG